MKLYQVVYSPEAEKQLLELYDYLAEATANDDVAMRFVTSIVRFCDGFIYFPARGELRDDIRQGLRITNYEGRTVIAFIVDQNRCLVEIIGIFYGGQHYERRLRDGF